MVAKKRKAKKVSPINSTKRSRETNIEGTDHTTRIESKDPDDLGSIQTSPVKSTASHNNSSNLTNLGSVTISQLFQRRDLKGLTTLTQHLSGRSQQEFENFKRTVERKNKTSETLISDLTKENTILKQKLKAFQHGKFKEVSEKETKDTKRKLIEAEESRKSAIDDLELLGSKYEMMELLCGTSCCGYDETDDKVTFKIIQRGESCSLVYKLIINKSGLSELLYIPVLDEPEEWKTESEVPWDDNITNLRKVLPEYLLNYLTFPSNTLRKFYDKISKSLSKKI